MHFKNHKTEIHEKRQTLLKASNIISLKNSKRKCRSMLILVLLTTIVPTVHVIIRSFCTGLIMILFVELPDTSAIVLSWIHKIITNISTRHIRRIKIQKKR